MGQPCKVLLFGLALSALFLDSSLAFTTASYFPSEPGTRWTYQKDSGELVTDTLLSRTEIINGAPTTVVKRSDGTDGYFTNDQNGVRLHRFTYFQYIEEVGRDVLTTLTFSPPLQQAYATAHIGQEIDSSGVVSVNFQGLGTYDLDYSAVVVIAGWETITVPAGTFRTLRIAITVRLLGQIESDPIDDTNESTDWYADAVGEVKIHDVTGGETEVLVSTNIDITDTDNDGIIDIADSVNEPAVIPAIITILLH